MMHFKLLILVVLLLCFNAINAFGDIVAIDTLSITKLYPMYNDVIYIITCNIESSMVYFCNSGMCRPMVEYIMGEHRCVQNIAAFKCTFDNFNNLNVTAIQFSDNHKGAYMCIGDKRVQSVVTVLLNANNPIIEPESFNIYLLIGSIVIVTIIIGIFVILCAVKRVHSLSNLKQGRRTCNSLPHPDAYSTIMRQQRPLPNPPPVEQYMEMTTGYSTIGPFIASANNTAVEDYINCTTSSEVDDYMLPSI